MCERSADDDVHSAHGGPDLKSRPSGRLRKPDSRKQIECGFGSAAAAAASHLYSHANQ